MKATHTPACGYSEDTEILTRGGWVRFGQLTYMDEVATRSPDGRFEWQHPQRIDVRPYDGEMVRFHGRSLNVLLAPGTPMLYAYDGRGGERIGLAGDLLIRAQSRSRACDGATFIATSTWDAPDLAERVFVSNRGTRKGPQPTPVSMSGDHYAAFMGMYITEGCAFRTTNDWRVQISQSERGKGWDEYRALLIDIFGHEPARNSGSWVIHSRALAEYLIPLGKALTKYLPHDIMDLSRRQLEIFWDYFFLGDGNLERHSPTCQPQVMATGSRVMAGQLQEIVQKLGYSGSMREYRHRPNAMVAAEGRIFKVRKRLTRFPSCAADLLPYIGMVGYARTPNGIAYVRRDGCPAWSGA